MGESRTTGHGLRIRNHLNQRRGRFFAQYYESLEHSQKEVQTESEYLQDKGRHYLISQGLNI